MKRLLVALMSAVFCLSCLCGVACGENEEASTDGADSAQSSTKNEEPKRELKVGDKVDVYPNCEFNYIVDGKNIIEDFTVHIFSISMTVSDIHRPNANQPLSGLYYPYTYNIVIKGQASPELYKRTLQIWISYSTGSRFDIKTIVSENGTIMCDYTLNRGNLSELYFSSISLIAA